jgi:hypothetical protein
MAFSIAMYFGKSRRPAVWRNGQFEKGPPRLAPVEESEVARLRGAAALVP